MNKKEAKKANGERLFYIGPNLPDGRMAHACAVIGELPAGVAELFAACPVLKTLFVPAARAAAALRALSKEGSVEQIAYKQTEKFFYGGGA